MTNSMLLFLYKPKPQRGVEFLIITLRIPSPFFTLYNNKEGNMIGLISLTLTSISIIAIYYMTCECFEYLDKIF